MGHKKMNADIKKALSVVKKTTGGFREKEIIRNYESSKYSNGGKTAEIYGLDGNGFQVVVKAFNSHKIGDITN